MARERLGWGKSSHPRWSITCTELCNVQPIGTSTKQILSHASKQINKNNPVQFMYRGREETKSGTKNYLFSKYVVAFVVQVQ